MGKDCEISGSVSNVNGSIQIGDQSTTGSINNVNGSITLGTGVVSGQVNTVNGSLTLGDQSRVKGNARTVNGQIAGGAEIRIEGDLGTTNGRIRLGQGSQVDGKVSTSNGDISLKGAQAGSLETYSGSLELLEGAIVEGALTVRRPERPPRQAPRVVIGENVQVGGPLVFEHEVKLFVHESAEIGEITGAEAEFYTDQPPRS